MVELSDAEKLALRRAVSEMYDLRLWWIADRFSLKSQAEQKEQKNKEAREECEQVIAEINAGTIVMSELAKMRSAARRIAIHKFEEAKNHADWHFSKACNEYEEELRECTNELMRELARLDGEVRDE